MFKPIRPLAALLSLACLAAAPAQAASKITFVSGKGADSGDCASPATPCRTFQFAVSRTLPSGEVKALDPAGYGRVTITQSISITGVEGASINVTSGDDITINAGPNDVINLSHLILDGVKTAQNGIVLNSGGSLTISHCTVRNFAGKGIRLQPTDSTNFLIADTIVSDNTREGIDVAPPRDGSAIGTLDHVLMRTNSIGISLNGFGTSGDVDVTVVDSVATNNGGRGPGFFLFRRGLLRLAHSAATGNDTGVLMDGGRVESAGDNFIRGNRIDVTGTLTFVGTQ